MCTKRRNNREKANWNIRINFSCILTACNNACEEHRLKSEAHIEYKEYQEKIKKCVSDVLERNLHVVRGEEHLGW